VQCAAARRVVWSVAALLSVCACRETRPTAAEGASLYRQNGCVTCHGRTGHGDGPIAATLSARPRDFRDASAFKNGTSVEAIVSTLATGMGDGNTAPEHRGHGPEHEQRVMPRFDHLTEHERRSIAMFVISLRSPSDERTQP
jgi:high-affinity iron transporter